ncbi:TIGR04283 family arsenosugar biosynthesis glycosyltransferase [uncultured Fibrella sp.]|uniref:TIGR04283 family arsenosugar biosynthesis glycosyltransferase n=1 Tax=uncultured Fibrella sp. TaxID=1284596 RepID=UPI0035C9D20C
MKISVIIPTYNEAATIERVVNDAFTHGHEQVVEVLVVDGGSTDETADIAHRAGATVLAAPTLGRAAQMNYGARLATGDVLYFVHADVRIHPDFVSDISHAIEQGYEAGRYRFRFDSDNVLLRFNSYSTRFGGLMSRGGDQTLFIRRTLFERLHGFDEHYVIMEDFDIIRRIEQQARFVVIPKDVVVSARKYEANSWLRVQLANLTAVLLFACNVSPTRIARTYRTLLK